MHPRQINRLDQLEQEQERLERQMEFTKKEFFRSAGTTASLGRSFLVKHVVLPAGAAGLGYVAAKKIFSHSPQASASVEAEAQEVDSSGSGNWFARLMLVLLPMAQQFFLKQQTEEMMDRSQQDGQHSPTLSAASPSPDLIYRIVPALIPILQQYFAKKLNQGNHADEAGPQGTGAQRTDNDPSGPSVINWLFQMIPVIVPLIQQHFLTQKLKAEKAEESASHAGLKEEAAIY